jgi:peptidoglycan hydrolase-like protein with peptidoglycan-binding domain
MPETTIKPWPLVREGAKDDAVKPLQHLLNDHSEDDEDRRIPVDGIFGTKTEAAVKAFQEAEKLQVDGIVGPKSWDKLIVQVKKGSEGDAVRGVQQAFKSRAQEPREDLKVDGIFGSKTETAVRGFQEALGVAVDGIVGPVTWRALITGAMLD